MRKAREEGLNKRPDRADRDLDEPQRQVLAEIQSGANLLIQFLSSQLDDADEKIRLRMPGAIEVDRSVAEARAHVAQAKLDHRQELEHSRLVERRKMRSLALFKRNNELTRDAAYADHPIEPIAVLAICFMFETLANAGIFKEAVDTGLLGGWMLSAIVSAINIALGFLIGWLGLRSIGHIKWYIKVIGGLITLGLIAASGYWNIVVANVREGLEAGGDPNQLVSLQTLKMVLTDVSRWFGFSSLQSWALLFIGGIVVVLAAVKGYGGKSSFSDPYWRYKTVDRAHVDAEQSYRHGQQDYKAAVAAAYDPPHQALLAEIEKQRENVAEIREIGDEAQQRAEEVRASIGEWADQGLALLRLYREENRAIRGSAPAPTYFDTYPDFSRLAVGLRDASAVTKLIEKAQAVHDANTQLMAKFEEALALVKEEETQKFLKEIDEIEKRAEETFQHDYVDLTGPISFGADPAFDT